MRARDASDNRRMTNNELRGGWLTDLKRRKTTMPPFIQPTRADAAITKADSPRSCDGRVEHHPA